LQGRLFEMIRKSIFLSASCSLYVPVMRAESALKTAADLTDLRLRVARLERSGAAGRTGKVDETGQDPAVLPFGIDMMDRHLPGRGLGLACLHEIAAAGPEVEHGAAASLFVAGLAARLEGMVLWVIEQRDLFAPGLAVAGLHPDRLIIAEAGHAEAGKAVLLVMEEGLRHRGLAAVVGEVHGRLGLTASRRLQLAAEAGGVTGFALRRVARGDDPVLSEANAAVTRWRISALSSAPAIPHAPDVPGLGRARWQVELLRCRGGEPSSWIMEAVDAAGRLGMAAAGPGGATARFHEQRQEQPRQQHQASG
jgi:protein ImuA